MKEVRPTTDNLELRYRILSTEYSHVTSMLTTTWSNAAERANLFFVAVSAAGIALALIGNGNHFSTIVLVVILAVLLLILVIGVVAESRLLRANRESVHHIQTLNRIRHFFVELDPGVAPYLTLPTHDDAIGVFGAHTDRSSFGAMTWWPAASVATLVALVDAFVAASVVGTAWLLLSGGQTFAAAVVAGVALVVGIVFFEGWVYRDLQLLRRGLDVRFPTPKRR